VASNYPGSLDSFDTIASDKKTSDAVGGRTHRAMHNDLGDAIEAVQGELGVNPSGTYDTVSDRIAAVEDGFPTIGIGDVTTGQADATITGNPDDGYELNLVLPGADGFVQQAAGGVLANGTNHIIGEDGTNAIASDVGTATVLGGGSPNYENVIGAASTANVNTSTSNLPTATGTGANWSVIVGGYDNVVNGSACVVSGYHNKVESTASHATISGGSIHSIGAGIDYATISGGTENTVTGDWAVVGGGVRNTAAQGATNSGGIENTASGTASVVGGGEDNVASGAQSTVGGGNVNQATGTTTTIAGGKTNSASGTSSVIGGGQNNTVNQNQATIAGGTNNTASGISATVGGGQYNTASGTAATIVGGRENTASGAAATAIGREAKADQETMVAFGGGKFSANGDAQGIKFVARRQTTNGTASEVLLNAAQRMVVPDDTTWAFTGVVVARRTDANNESAGYKIEGVIDRNSGAGTVALVGTPTVTVLGEDTAAWDVTVSADTSYGSLKVAVTGEASKTINWVAFIDVASTTG